MFKFAQAIIRHKIGVLAVIASAFILFSRDGGEEVAKPASPWAKQSPVAAVESGAKDKDSMVSKAVDAASDYVGEATGINPKELAGSNTDNWNKTSEAFDKANKGE